MYFFLPNNVEYFFRLGKLVKCARNSFASTTAEKYVREEKEIIGPRVWGRRVLIVEPTFHK